MGVALEQRPLLLQALLEPMEVLVPCLSGLDEPLGQLLPESMGPPRALDCCCSHARPGKTKNTKFQNLTIGSSSRQCGSVTPTMFSGLLKNVNDSDIPPSPPSPY